MADTEKFAFCKPFLRWGLSLNGIIWVSERKERTTCARQLTELVVALYYVCGQWYTGEPFISFMCCCLQPPNQMNLLQKKKKPCNGWIGFLINWGSFNKLWLWASYLKLSVDTVFKAQVHLETVLGRNVTVVFFRLPRPDQSSQRNSNVWSSATENTVHRH